jgi:hypothetical protein
VSRRAEAVASTATPKASVEANPLAEAPVAEDGTDSDWLAEAGN